MQGDLDSLSGAEDALLAEAGKLGARRAQLDLVGEQTERNITLVNEVVSSLRDADMAEIAIDLQSENMVYQALLTSVARITGASLMDYLG